MIGPDGTPFFLGGAAGPRVSVDKSEAYFTHTKVCLGCLNTIYYTFIIHFILHETCFCFCQHECTDYQIIFIFLLVKNACWPMFFYIRFYLLFIHNIII